MACSQSWTQRLVEEQEDLFDAGDPNTWGFEQVASSYDGVNLVAITGGTGVGHPTPIFVSHDSGATWQRSGAPLGYWSSVVSSADGLKLVVSGTVTGDRENDPNIYTSDNGGMTWTGRHLPYKSFKKMACSSDGSKVIGVSPAGDFNFNGASIWLSTDSGATWSAAPSLVAEKGFSSVASSADGSRLAAAGLDFGNSFSYVYLSSDSGKSWGLANLPTNLGTGSWLAVASSADGQKLVATAASPNRLYTSTNAGANWTLQAAAPNEFFHALASSADGSRLVAGGGATPGGDIYISNDSGVTWRADYNPPRTFFNNRPIGYASVASSSDGRKLVAIGDGIGFHTLDLGGPLKVDYSILPVKDPEHQFALCDDFQVIATVTNTTDDTITDVAPLAAPVEGVNGIVRALAPALPNVAQTLAAHGHTTFTWTFRAEKIGQAYLSGKFKGTLNDIPFSMTATAPFALTIIRPDLVVNMTSDESAVDPTHGCADVNASKSGRQTTLRAAIETANAWAGRDVIYFDLPENGSSDISLTKPLPPLTEGCEIRGKSQPRTGKVGIFGYSFVDGAKGSAAIELKGNSSVNGLAFTSFGKSKTPLVLMSNGSNEVTGCGFGEDVSGNPASGGSISIQVTGGTQRVGGTGATMGNRFFSGDVGVLISRISGGAVPKGTIIEGNQFGSEDGLETGPVNAIVIDNAASTRVGGTVTAARNTLVGSKGAAILIGGAASEKNEIIGNVLGLRKNGSAVGTGAQNGYGIYVIGGAHDNRIGGSDPKARNIISGSGDAGIVFSKGTHDNLVEGNWIGLAADGSSVAPSEIGVFMLAGTNNRIGGKSAGQRNVISGNLSYGICIGRDENTKFTNKNDDPGQEFCIGSVIQGNWIGLDKSGTKAVPNGVSFRSDKGAGIYLAKFAKSTLIGGKTSSVRNVISGNEGLGILVKAAPDIQNGIFGNHIGTTIGASSGIPNKLGGIAVMGESTVTIGGYGNGQPNRIAYNGGPGIDLSKLNRNAKGMTVAGNFVYNSNPRMPGIILGKAASLNDDGDTDKGPNGLQNWPILLKARNAGGKTTITADLSSFKKDIKVRMDFFRRAGGGGDLPIFTKNVFTGSEPNDLYEVNAPLQFAGTQIVGLATTQEGSSQFSAPVTVVAGKKTKDDRVPDLRNLTMVPQPKKSQAGATSGNELKPMRLTVLPGSPTISRDPASAGPSAANPKEPQITVRIEMPTESENLILETSIDLIHWQDTGADMTQAGSNIDLKYPASEMRRYFRWHRIP